MADDRVEASMYHRAVGYNFHSEKVMQFQGKIVRAKTVEHVPPDVGAITLWLHNRRPEKWRNNTEPSVTLHISLAELVNNSYRADLPALAAPKVEVEQE